LKKRKSEWVAKGYTRYPTFIQVNQIQIGDALKFVNELNDADYQVTGKVPKDSAGEWIANASADMESAFDVESSFTGELCFKAWETVFKPSGGKCECEPCI
jgi:hypothetical protein